MGWEYRSGKHRYYRKVRRDGQVVSEYIGTGPAAELASRMEKARRAEAEAERAAIKRLQSQDDEAVRLFTKVGEFTRDALLALGFRQHKNQWRKRRMKKKVEENPNMALIHRANSSNEISKEDQDALKHLMSKRPAEWNKFGDMMMRARAALIDGIDAAAIFKESLYFRTETMMQELSCEGDGLLERLLIEQVVLCWTRLSIAELRFTQVSKEDRSIKVSLYWEKHLSEAQKRYLKACKGLAQVRKLLRPVTTLQVNLATDGGQQINFVGSEKK